MAITMRKLACFLLIFVNFWLSIAAKKSKLSEDNASGTFEALDNFLSSLDGGTEGCEYKCPRDGEVKRPTPGHVPSSNGCGSFGVKLETESLPEMTTCCDVHDKCYDTCGNDRDVCDEEFESCLTEMCEDRKNTLTKDQYDGCKMMSELMVTTTKSMGCPSFLTAQKKACTCRLDPVAHFDEEIKHRDVMEVLDSMDHLLDLDAKDEL